MSKISFNCAEIPDEMPLPPLNEPVTVELLGTSDSPSKSSGKEMITLEFAVQADGTDYHNYRLREYLSEPGTNRKTWIKAKQIGRAFGMDDAAMTEAGGVPCADLIGKTCQVLLKKDKDLDGAETRRIKSFVR